MVTTLGLDMDSCRDLAVVVFAVSRAHFST
jgi:hypothetical protein